MVSKPALGKLVSSAVLGLILVQSAHARPIRIDAGTSAFPSDGQAWQDPVFQTEATASHVLNFSLSIGGQSYSGMCASQLGFVWFSSGDCGTPTSVSDLGGVPYIAPLVNPAFALDPNLGFGDGITSLNAVTISSGLLNPFAPPYGTSYCTDPEDVSGCIASEAANGNLFSVQRINWTYDLDGNTNSVEPFQIVFRDLSASGSAGDFDMEINYNERLDALSGLYAPLFDFGSGPVTWTIAELDNPVFTFRNGVLVTDTPPSGVPEPATLTLFALGLLGLALARRRRGVAANSVS